jgi:hypothetical protein
MGLLINRVSTRSLTERIAGPRCQLSVCIRRQTATRTLLRVTHDSEDGHRAGPLRLPGRICLSDERVNSPPTTMSVTCDNAANRCEDRCCRFDACQRNVPQDGLHLSQARPRNHRSGPPILLSPFGCPNGAPFWHSINSRHRYSGSLPPLARMDPLIVSPLLGSRALQSRDIDVERKTVRSTYGDPGDTDPRIFDSPSENQRTRRPCSNSGSRCPLGSAA